MLQGYVENPMIQEVETPAEDLNRSITFGFEMSKAERERWEENLRKRLRGEDEDE